MARTSIRASVIPNPAPLSSRLTERSEKVVSGRSRNLVEISPGVFLRELASQACGVQGMCTGLAVFSPASSLPYHRHDVSEAFTVLSGEGVAMVEGRTYPMGPLDCLHVPAGVAHSVVNPSTKKKLMIHAAFGAVHPRRDFVKDAFVSVDRNYGLPDKNAPEHMVRIGKATRYKLANGTSFCDLFAGRFGSVGICGGYGEFQPGTGLPCHLHDYDESITIIKGAATCRVMGARYELSGYDTAMVPSGRPHRFLNESKEVMAMIWVYAGSEPQRTLLDARFCNGDWQWKGKASSTKA
jgi:mannose-6-phosphate isomerase-like protein (cupin superfamily)